MHSSLHWFNYFILFLDLFCSKIIQKNSKKNSSKFSDILLVCKYARTHVLMQVLLVIFEAFVLVITLSSLFIELIFVELGVLTKLQLHIDIDVLLELIYLNYHIMVMKIISSGNGVTWDNLRFKREKIKKFKKYFTHKKFLYLRNFYIVPGT